MNGVLGVILGLSVLVDLALGAWAGAAWGSYQSRWLPDLVRLTGPPAESVRLLGLVLGLCLFCFAALQGLALYWVRKENEAGHRVAIVFGGWLVLSSIIVFGLFHRPEFLLIDGLRGAALAVVGALALNAPATVRELRLPEPHERRREDPRRSGGREPRRRGGPDRRDRRDRGGASGDRGRRRERPSGSRREGRPESAGSSERAPRRSPAEDPERPLTVVIHGKPDRLRPLGLAATAATEPTTEPADAADREGSDPRGRRRRRRRRREGGGEGESRGAELRRPSAADLAASDAGDGDSEREDSLVSGGADEGAVERDGRRRRRRRRRSGGGEGRSESVESEGGEREEVSGRSPAEALDMLSLLEPAHRSGADQAFGRGQRPSGRHRPTATRSALSGGPGPQGGEHGETTPPPSVRPDYGREEGSDSEREPD